MEQLEKKESKEEKESEEITSSSFLPYHQAIQKEYKYLDTAEKEARKNRQQQKQAMQKVLSMNKKASISSKVTPSIQPQSEESKQSALYEDLFEKSQPHQYSKLRARTRISGSQKTTSFLTLSEEKITDQEQSSSYMQYYCSMVARVAKYLLHLKGDEEEDGHVKKYT
jgi:hypothetical protein